jgi:hypothetical protein
MFLLAVATVVAAAATHRVYPLFIAWLPLIGVPWILARPNRDDEPPKPDESGAAEQA